MNQAILEIPDLWHEIAESAPRSLNSRSVNSFSQYTGVIGELAAATFMASHDVPFVHVDDYDYDFTVFDVKIDVKTNAPKCSPDRHNNIMMTDYLRNQGCDLYVFAAVYMNLNLVQLMGFCEKSWFWSCEQGIDLKKGEKLYVTPIKQDARFLDYKHINNIYGLLDYLGE